MFLHFVRIELNEVLNDPRLIDSNCSSRLRNCKLHNTVREGVEADVPINYIIYTPRVFAKKKTVLWASNWKGTESFRVPTTRRVPYIMLTKWFASAMSVSHQTPNLQSH